MDVHRAAHEQVGQDEVVSTSKSFVTLHELEEVHELDDVWGTEVKESHAIRSPKDSVLDLQGRCLGRLGRHDPKRRSPRHVTSKSVGPTEVVENQNMEFPLSPPSCFTVAD